MDWNADEVAHWLKEIGLPKYAKRFKGNWFLTLLIQLFLLSDTLIQWAMLDSKWVEWKFSVIQHEQYQSDREIVKHDKVMQYRLFQMFWQKSFVKLFCSTKMGKFRQIFTTQSYL